MSPNTSTLPAADHFLQGKTWCGLAFRHRITLSMD